jgi:chromosome segregation ATPase
LTQSNNDSALLCGLEETMTAEKTIQVALSELSSAINSLENAIDMRIERQRENGEVESEVKRVHVDRARLAQELDQSQFRANRLEEVNREVSRRLVTAMETIRAVLDR